MMKALFFFEWKLFWSNIKNIVALAVFIFLCLYLTLAVEPDYRPNRAIEYDEIAATNRDANYFIENNDPEIFQRSIPLFQEIAASSETLLEALEQEDYRTVMELEPTYYSQNMSRFSGQDPNYYVFGVPEGVRNRKKTYDNLATTSHYEFLRDGNYVLSLEIIEGRTALQALTRQLMGILPLILFLIVIIYGMDIFAADKHHQTIVNELPLSKYKRLGVKSLVVFSAFILTFILGTSIFVLLTGLRTGFGGFNLPVPQMQFNLSIGQFLLQTILLLALIALIFSRSMAWGSLLINQPIVNLLFIPLIFAGSLWYETGITYGHPEISFLPPTFFRVGDVISGFLNFWYSSEFITFGTGIGILSTLLLMIELLNLVTIRIQKD